MSGEEVANDVQPLSKKIKLVLKTSPRATPIDINTSFTSTSKADSSSPPRPSYSPVTPTGSHESGRLHEKQEVRWVDKEPDAAPVSLDENSDAIALRAAISLLQMQRQKALRDIRDLDKMRDLALTHPDAFVQELQEGKLNSPANMNFDVDTDEEDEQGQAASAAKKTEQAGSLTSVKFGRLPEPQSITRMPPIEWSKYHILSKPLESIHARQINTSRVVSNTAASNTDQDLVSAPYRPFHDSIPR